MLHKWKRQISKSNNKRRKSVRRRHACSSLSSRRLRLWRHCGISVKSRVESIVQAVSCVLSTHRHCFFAFTVPQFPELSSFPAALDGSASLPPSQSKDFRLMIPLRVFVFFVLSLASGFRLVRPKVPQAEGDFISFCVRLLAKYSKCYNVTEFQCSWVFASLGTVGSEFSTFFFLFFFWLGGEWKTLSEIELEARVDMDYDLFFFLLLAPRFFKFFSQICPVPISRLFEIDESWRRSGTELLEHSVSFFHWGLGRKKLH